MPLVETRWTHALRRAAGFRSFFQKFLERLFVQRQVGHHPLQLGVLRFQLPKSPGVAHAQAPELRLPSEKGRLADAHLPAHFLNRGSALGLLQGQRQSADR
jgi:hypothetical protein